MDLSSVTCTCITVDSLSIMGLINYIYTSIYDQEAVIYEAVMLSEDIEFMIHVQPTYS